MRNLDTAITEIFGKTDLGELETSWTKVYGGKDWHSSFNTDPPANDDYEDSYWLELEKRN